MNNSELNLKYFKLEKTKEIFFVFLLFFVPYFTYGQYKIEGTIKDTLETIPFADIILLDDANTILTGTISDEKGNFELSYKEGNYFIKINFLGYNEWQQEIKLTQDIDLGVILLENQTNELGEVVVTAKRPLIERRVDRLIFNVENSVAVTGGTALDALKLTPRIRVRNDQISMIGKGGMMVLLNDRPLQLSGEDLAEFLKTLNAEDIKRIEVIANPPAKYSAEGNSGVLNIVTKSVKSDTWNANARSIYQQATYATGLLGGGFNFQKGKFELTSAIGYTNGSNAPFETDRILYPNLLWDSENNRKDTRNNYNGRIGINYNINEKLKTGISANYFNNNILIRSEDVTELSTINSTIDSLLITNARDHLDVRSKSLNTYFIYEMDTVGKKLSLDLDVFSYRNARNRPFQTETLEADNTPISSSFVEGRNEGVQEIRNYSFNIDMEHPTEWVQLNYGGRVSGIRTDNTFNFFNVENGMEVIDQNVSNQFQYRENVQALYASGQKEFNEKWEAKFGLRYEWTQTEGFSLTNNETNIFNYSKLFPTFYLSYVADNNHTFSFDYGRRIQRPNFSLLNPFRITINPFSFTEGNPFLQPSFTDNFEISYTYKNNLISNLYFSYLDDGFEQIILLDAETNISQVIPLNFIMNKTVGLNQTHIVKPFNFWQTYTTADIYYTSTDSTIPEALQFLSGWNGEFSISNDFMLNSKKTLLANFSYTYVTRGVDHLDTNTSFHYANASLKYVLLDGNLTLSLYGNDIFRTGFVRYTTFTNGIENSFLNYYDEQFFRIGVLYSFGKSFNSKDMRSKNQEELNRVN